MPCSATSYDYLRKLVQAQSANVIGSAHDKLFNMRLTSMATLAGAAGLDDFVEMLRKQPAGKLHYKVAEAMTINETSFFRDVRTFETIRNVLLPRIIDARRAQRRLRIWSAACSTGQEAASIAMLLSDRFPEVMDWDVRIIGTDIADNVVERARTGRYRRNEINRGLPARLLVKYFTRHGDEWELDGRLRRMCEFTHINLCEPLPEMPQFDLVLLRNVLLYFSPQDRTCVLNAAHRLLASDGYLVLGAAEQAEDSTDLFQAEFGGESFFYRSAA